MRDLCNAGEAATALAALVDFKQGMPQGAAASAEGKLTLEPVHDGKALRLEGGPSRR